MKILIKNHILSFALILITTVNVKAQYRGGFGDGSAANDLISQNSLPNIYHGGYNDGTATKTLINNNTLLNIYTGGNNDGNSMAYVTAQNYQANIYAGGKGDGSSESDVFQKNSLNNIYSGGNADGFATVVLLNNNNELNIYNGGNSDGFASSSISTLNPLNNIYGGGGDDGFVSITVNNLNPLNNLKLSLAGEWKSENILVNWQTKNEENVLYYELERSKDGGNHFEKIANINVSSKGINDYYAYTDEDTHNATVFYYRIKSIDKKGNATYSAMVRLNKKAKAVTYTIYPNPGKGLFNISIKGADDLNNYAYRVLNTTGQEIMKGSITAATTQFDISRLAAGVYYIQILNRQQLQNTYKIILQH